MATTFSKNYAIDVTFRKSDVSAITDADINSVEMRNEIKQMIKEVCTRSCGIFEAQADGDVTET